MKLSIASSLQRTLSAVALFTAASAQAAITVTPTYDASFTSQPNFAELQTTVNNALAIYSSNVGDNLTIPITFKLDAAVSGAQSSYLTSDFSFAAYRAALVTHAATANDAIVLAGLPVGATDPVIGGPNIAVTQALGLALGLSGAQASYGTVTFNLADYRTNPAGFLGTIQHEVNEVLGTGSNLPNNTGAGTLPTTISAADLFRYTAAGTRSYSLNLTSDPTNKAFFRLDSTGANLQEFNNLPNGGDYGDWYTGNGRLFAVAPQDQSGDPSTFTSMSISSAELNLLDAVGYNAFPVPEPGTLTALSSVAVGFLAVRRRRNGNFAVRR